MINLNFMKFSNNSQNISKKHFNISIEFRVIRLIMTWQVNE